jgi:hypothetical protein
VLSTNQLGLIAETAIIHECATLGVGVSRPLDDEAYDIILDLKPGLVRVQCKWAQRKGEVIIVRCRRCRRGPEGMIHRGYDADEIDAVAAYCADLKRNFLLPKSMSVGRTNVQLRLGPCRNNQRTGINWAQDFELEATLKTFRGPIAQLGERQRGTLEAAGSSPAGSTF